jgi:hypothetical protein
VMFTAQNAKTQSSCPIYLDRLLMRSKRSSSRLAWGHGVSQKVSTFHATSAVTQTATARHPKPTENGFVNPNNFYMHRQE